MVSGRFGGKNMPPSDVTIASGRRATLFGVALSKFAMYDLFIADAARAENAPGRAIEHLKRSHWWI
jgi:hypothetical protein